MRFSLVAGQRVTGKGGKLFCCPACHYECQADFNASVNGIGSREYNQAAERLIRLQVGWENGWGGQSR